MKNVYFDQLNNYRFFLVLAIVAAALLSVFSLGVVLAAAPIANDDGYETNEDITLNVLAPGVLGNDGPGEGITLTAVLENSPITGTLALSATGAFAYTPTLNFSGLVSFTYFASDEISSSLSAATVIITVTAVNDPPVANNDSYTTTEDIPLTITAPGVLDNDSDVDGGALSASLDADPLSGVLNLSSDGSFIYTPTLDYNGLITFTYFANDTISNSLATGTVTVTVTAVNDPPVANNDSYTTTEDIPLTITAPGVLDNDSDVDGGALSASLDADPLSGVLNLSSDGSFIYTPTLDYNGLITFTYFANDTISNSLATGTVTVTVTAVNDPPIANNDSYTTTEDIPLTITAPGVLDNDSDVDGGALSASLDADPLSGVLNLSSDGSFIYTPTLDYNGLITFTYFANDTISNSLPATVFITVTAVNDHPILSTNDSLVVLEGMTETITNSLLLVTDVDNFANDLIFTLEAPPNNGQLMRSGINLTQSNTFTQDDINLDLLTYSHDGGETTADSFDFTVLDGAGGSISATTFLITITPVNDPPAAEDDRTTTPEDVAVTTDVLANDDDTDGSLDPASVNVTSGPGDGSAGVNLSNGFITYTPTVNFNGNDSYIYEVCDDGLPLPAQCVTATVALTVTAVNDHPILSTNAGLVVPEGMTDTITDSLLLVTDVDNFANDLIFTLEAPPNNGQLMRSGINLTQSNTFSQNDINLDLLTYSHDGGETTADSFDFTVSDGAGGSISATTFLITITPVNDPPTANDDFNATDEDSPLTEPPTGVLTNDTDPDSGDTKTVTSFDATSPNGAAVTINADGSYTYNPTGSAMLNALAVGESIIDTFAYTMSDGDGITDTAVVSITVSGVNDLPTAIDDTSATDEDTFLTIGVLFGVLANDTDPDTSDALTVSSFDFSSANGAAVSVNSDGSYSYDPISATALQALDDGDLLIDTFTYTVTDGHGGNNTAVASITITGVNDAPVLDNSGDMSLDDIGEDTADPSGDLVVSIIASAGGNRITDADASATEGIAVINIDNTNGAWEYTLNNGTDWLPFSAVSDTAAVLLDATGGSTGIRFVPNANYNGSAGNVAFRAWDRTIGANGDTGVDVSINGGTTAYSVDTETAALTVASENDAPVLDNTGIMTLTNILEDTTDPPGDTVAAIINSADGDRITDVDIGDAEGFAVIGADNANGVWQYRTNAFWHDFGSVSDSSAVLLDTDALIRFVPAADYFGSAGNITFRAWDQTEGSSGNDNVDVADNGGIMAYSSLTETATLTVANVNDAPALDLDSSGSGTGFSTTFTEDGGNVVVVDTDLTVSDVDHTDLISATATLLNLPDNIAESLAVDTASAAISASYDSNAGILTLAGTDTVSNYQTVLRTLVYTNTSQNPDTTTRTIEIVASDSLTNSNTAVSEVSIIAVNDDPELTTNTGLNVNEGHSNTIYVGRLEATDPDNSATELSYTVTNLPINGTLLLNSVTLNLNDTFTQDDIDNSLLDYLHDGSETTSDSFNFTVADGAGGIINTTTFTIAVASENDAPILETNTGLAVDEGNSGIITNSQLRASDVDNTLNELTYHLEITPTNGLLKLDDSPLIKNDIFTQGDIDNNRISYFHDGSEGPLDHFTFAVDDQSGGQIDSSVFTITVNAVNDLPILDLNGAGSGSDFAAAFTEDSGGVIIVDTDLSITDADNVALAEGRAFLTNRPNGTAESLSVATSGTSITANYNPATGILTLTGPATVAHFQDVFRSLAYNNTSQNPDTTTRTVSIIVNDGLDDSNVTNSIITIIAVNDPPTLVTNNGLTNDYGQLKVITSSDLRVTDPDNTSDELNYTVPAVPEHGRLTLNGVILTVNDTFTQADINSNRLAYEHDKSNTESDSFDFSVEDGNGGIMGVQTFNLIIRPQPKIYLPTVLNNYIYSEPNDLACAAFGIGLNHNYQFLPDDDEDWYVFSLNTPGNLTVDITNYSSPEGHLLLYKRITTCEDLEWHQFWHDSSITPSGSITANSLSPGTYYVRVFTAVVPSNPSAYTLRVQSP